MFDDVIRWLLMGLGHQTKAEKKWVEAHPLRLPTDDEQIRRARRVLEAAAKLQRSNALAWLDAAHAGCPDYDVKDAIRALLSALPGGDA